jgi:hypothetical protein
MAPKSQEAIPHMATSKKSARRKPDARETEFSRFLNESLDRLDVNKKELILAMPSLRRTGEGESPGSGRHFKRVSSGAATPDLEFVIEVATALKLINGKGLTQEDVALWLGAWLHDYLLKTADRVRTRGGRTARKAKLKREAIASFMDASHTIVNRWRRSLNVKRGIDTSHPPTMADKEYILYNCAIIVGASVQHPPSRTEQLFRENAQVSDLMYLPHLDFGPRPLFLTDNMVIALSEPERKKLLGRRHLLVIGGPLVNVATRYLNNISIFPFCLKEDKRYFDDIFDMLKGLKSLRNSLNVGMFDKLLRMPLSDVNLADESFRAPDARKVLDDVKRFREHFELEDDVVYKQILYWLTDSSHFFDPLTCRVVGISSKYPHPGVISVGTNHWADDPHFVSVVVAGFDEFGTVAALRTLLHSCDERPCGGVLHAVLPQEGSEYLRFKEAQFSWITDPYEIHDLKVSLGRVRNENRSGRPPFEAFHGNETYFNQYADFIGTFKG